MDGRRERGLWLQPLRRNSKPGMTTGAVTETCSCRRARRPCFDTVSTVENDFRQPSRSRHAAHGDASFTGESCAKPH